MNNMKCKSGVPRNLVILEIIDKQNANATKIIPVSSSSANAMQSRTTASLISTNEMPKIQLKPNISTFSISPVIVSSAGDTAATTTTATVLYTMPSPSLSKASVIATKKPATVLLLSQASLSELLQSVELNINNNNNNNHAKRHHENRGDETPQRCTVIESKSQHIITNNNNHHHHQIIHHTDHSLTTSTNTNNSHNKIDSVKSDVAHAANDHSISHKLQTIPSILMINSSALTATGATISRATSTAAATLMAATAAKTVFSNNNMQVWINHTVNICVFNFFVCGKMP